MTANPHVTVTIPPPTIHVTSSQPGDVRAMTVLRLLNFAHDLEVAVEAGLDPHAKVKFLRTGDWGEIYAASASSTIDRKDRT